MALATFQSLITEFGGRLGVPKMATDEEGYVALTFDSVELHLQYEAEEDDVVVFTRLGEVEVDRAAEIYGMLLGANLFWQGTRGATFSLEPDLGVVFLADRRALDRLDVQSLNDWLERFLDTAGYWRKRLHDANAGGPLIDPDLPDETPPSPPEERGLGGPEIFIRG